MDVSVVIVNWNTKALLHDCLVSVLEQAGDVDYEIIVVDNASSDGSADMVQSDFPDVTLVVELANRGYAAGVNAGIRVAQGRYVLVLNSDILFCDAAIARTVRYADTHPEAAVVGCQVRENQEKAQMTCFGFPGLLNLFLRVSGLAMCFKKNRFFGREDMRWWQRDTEREVDVISGMFMLVRRKAIDEVGLMDEDYFLYCEETDWCYRFSRAGWKMLFWPGASIIHLDGGGHSSKTDRLKLKIQMQKSILLFLQKHYGIVASCAGRVLLSFHAACKYIVCAALSAWGRIRGRNVDRELAEKEERWSVLMYCVCGCEPREV
ncbi:MAG: glycosyltransferase family 2 protein [Sedimentisphaerales bacterium]|nr:glycosyltransferase family 2 protein [Sedimentisphaerales bacterium]